MTTQLTTAADESGPASAEPSAEDRRRSDRWGWIGVAVLTAAIAATWIPRLGIPFGDNHMGRIIGRYGLHLQNLQEKGIVGSDFSADWVPYSDAAYAHHPPLLNILTALFGTFPGNSEAEIWLAPYLLALLIVPSSAALLRGLGIRWIPTLVSVGLMSATTFFWVYSPIMFDLGPILALSACVVHLRNQARPKRWLVVTTCAAAILATTVSWPGIAFAAALGIWLLMGRKRVDRITVAVGASMVFGVLLSLAFVVGVSGMAELTNQTEMRTAGGSFTVMEFVRRQGGYINALLPIWYVVLIPIAAIAGLVDRRTRLYTAFATLFTAVWIVGLNNGAFIHDYWSYPVLIVGVVGGGALFDWIAGLLPRPLTLAGGAIGGALILAWLAFIVFGPVGNRYVERPTDAGTLVEANGPAPGQKTAWVAGGGVSTPRWLAYYWKLTPRSLTPQLLDTDAPRPDDLVLMNVTRLPTWLPPTIVDEAVAEKGNYALFRVSDLKAAEIPN